jgi:hypothetical protein
MRLSPLTVRGRAAHATQQAQVELGAGDADEQHGADLGDAVQQVHLVRIGGKQPVRGSGQHM